MQDILKQSGYEIMSPIQAMAIEIELEVQVKETFGDQNLYE